MVFQRLDDAVLMNHGLAHAKGSILTIAVLAFPLAAPGRCITMAASMLGAKPSESFDYLYDRRYTTRKQSKRISRDSILNYNERIVF